jgi:hypothetical protein
MDTQDTRNASIYHCVACGRVVHAEIEAEPPPQCCGQAMAKAFTETIRESDVAGEKAGGQSATAPPASKDHTKPR